MQSYLKQLALAIAVLIVCSYTAYTIGRDVTAIDSSLSTITVTGASEDDITCLTPCSIERASYGLVITGGK